MRGLCRRLNAQPVASETNLGGNRLSNLLPPRLGATGDPRGLTPRFLRAHRHQHDPEQALDSDTMSSFTVRAMEPGWKREKDRRYEHQ